MSTGVVEKIDFTSGGAGNQWTTISGTRYATWWNVSTIDWKLGDTVSFEPFAAVLWSGQPAVAGARDIHKATGSAV